MNETNTRKFSALAVELVYKLDDKELANAFNSITDNWGMEFTEDNTGLIHVIKDGDDEEDYTYGDDEPSWTELMQDYYPSDENGKVFDTESGF